MAEKKSHRVWKGKTVILDEIEISMSRSELSNGNFHHNRET